MSETLKKKQPLPWWRRILLCLVLVAIVLLSALMPASYLAGRQLGTEIVKISQAGEPLTFADLEASFSQSSTGEDAARHYDEALASIGLESLTDFINVNNLYRENMTSLPAGQITDEVREKVTQSLANFQPMLEKLDTGAGLSLSHFDIGIKYGIRMCQTNLNRAQTAAILSSVRTLDLILQGESDAAANSVISILKMMRILDFHPTMIVYLTKAGLTGLACKDIQLLLEHGQPSEESLAKLQKLVSQAIPTNALEKMFLAERVYQIELGRNLIPKNITSRLLQNEVSYLPERLSRPSTFWGRLRIRQGSTQYLRDMARLITAAHHSWPGPLDVIVGGSPESAKKPSSLIASGAAVIRLTAETLVIMRCTMLAVAVERYRRSHGELPHSLYELCPTYIDSVPLDPFIGNRLLYDHDEEGYTIYSVGTNRQDDGGSIEPKFDEKKPLDKGLRIHFRKAE